MRNSSYESILRAVGQLLDATDAQSFALRETEDGLHLEATGEVPLSLSLDIAEVSQLLDWSAAADEAPHYDRAYAANEGTLHQFLARHELVGAR